MESKLLNNDTHAVPIDQFGFSQLDPNLSFSDFDFDFDNEHDPFVEEILNQTQPRKFKSRFRSRYNIGNQNIFPRNLLTPEDKPIDNKKLTSVIFHKFFTKEFICNSIDLCDKLSTRDLLKYESSDKIILPASALSIFASSSRDNLYVLRLMNPKNSKYAFVGIGDFCSPERVMFAPKWIMDYMSCQNGEKIYVDAISVPQVSYAKIKIPDELNKVLNSNDKSVASLNIKAVLEFILTNHCLLFLGKKIRARIFEKIWEFEVEALKPVNIGSITNADVQLEII